MNRRFLLRFLALAPFAAPVAIIAARAAPAAGAPAGQESIARIMAHARQVLDDAPALQSYIDGRLHFHSRPLTEAERAEFRRRYIDIDRVLRDEAELLESRHAYRGRTHTH